MTYDLTWADEWETSWDKRPRAASFCWPWGAMRWLQPVMQQLGMVFDANYDWHTVWPKSAGIPDDDWDEEDPAKWSQARRDYEAVEKLVAEKRFEHPGIPLHKFESNAPWRIWPDEITSALERYAERIDGYTLEEDWQRENFGRFAAYLLLAVEHGGCIVH